MKDNNNKSDIGRRDFLKLMGTGAVATTAALYGCRPKDNGTAAVAMGEVPIDKMTYRTSTRTKDKVSLLGYGCMRWPLRKNDRGEDEIDQDKVNELVDYAIAHGVNYFDTSPRYVRGLSEAATGIALSRHPRDKYFIATKMSNQAEDPYLRSFKGSVEMYHKSMKELQVDYLDYYLLHSVGGGSDSMATLRNRYYDNGLLDFLLKEREKGRIRNLGWSFHGDVKVFDYLLSTGIQWDFVQIQLNYVDWKHATGFNVNADYLYGELAKRNIQSVIMEPLLGGRLSQLPEHLMRMLKQQRPEESIASWAFRYAGTPEQVLCVLSGMVYMEHLQDNLRAYSPLDPISPEENKLLEHVAELYQRYPIVPCTDCQYCMPCLYGINIPGVFAHYNRCVNEGHVSHSSQDENYRAARRAFLIGYDRNVPKLRQAAHCIGCGVCTNLCPQRIKIPQEMERIDKYAEQLKQGAEF